MGNHRANPETGDQVNAHHNHGAMPHHRVDANADLIGEYGRGIGHDGQAGNQTEDADEGIAAFFAFLVFKPRSD